MLFIQVVLICGVSNELYCSITVFFIWHNLYWVAGALSLDCIETIMLPQGAFCFSREVINLLCLFFSHFSRGRKILHQCDVIILSANFDGNYRWFLNVFNSDSDKHPVNGSTYSTITETLCSDLQMERDLNTYRTITEVLCSDLQMERDLNMDEKISENVLM